jgi:hypothetical protein
MTSMALAEADSCEWGDAKPFAHFWFRLITNQFFVL